VHTSNAKLPDCYQTANSRAFGEGKIVRQMRGRSEFARIVVGVEPLERNSGLKLKAEPVIPGAVPPRLFPAIEDALVSAGQNGLWGFPLADMLIFVEDGAYHDFDSTPDVFREAATRALLNALTGSDPRLLEMIVRLTIRVPERYVGPLTKYLQGEQHACPTNTGEMLEIVRLVRQSEAQAYEDDVFQLTSGNASCSRSPEKRRILDSTETAEFFCSTCGREMVLPLLRGKPCSSTCLMCGTRLEPPYREWMPVS
jgi:elongation factor G